MSVLAAALIVLAGMFPGQPVPAPAIVHTDQTQLTVEQGYQILERSAAHDD